MRALTPARAKIVPPATSDHRLMPVDATTEAPSRDGHATFQRLDANPRWKGVADLDQADAGQPSRKHPDRRWSCVRHVVAFPRSDRHYLVRTSKTAPAESP
jgi:hypothetical protein